MGKGGCGVFAYLNYGVVRQQSYIIDSLLTGLRRLEYRGYDSAGLAIDAVAGDGVRRRAADGETSKIPAPLCFKEQGKIDALSSLIDASGKEHGLNLAAPFEFHAGIAHTRWATHGEPAPRNSHPHTSDATNEFLVVHNGIITNYAVLKEMLMRHGFVFVSETDTEVIPKLAKYLYDSFPAHTKPSFLQLVQLIMLKIDGAYAIIFKSSHYPGELVACKRGSPLLLAIRDPEAESAAASSPTGPDSGAHGGFPPPAMEARPRPGKRRRVERIEFFLSSDASAVIEHTKKVVVLEDDDIVHLADGAYGVYRLDRSGSATPGAEPKAVVRALQVLEMEVEQIMKGSFEHFMAKEIYEQPESLTNTMRGRVVAPCAQHPDGRIQLGGIVANAAAIRRSRRLILVGCGTSFHGCLAVRPLLEEMTELPVQMELASDMLDRRCPVGRSDTAIFVSQSGETADTLRALEYCRDAGALCVGVTNTVGSAIARGTSCGIHINAGAEIGVASTKAYTSQIVALAMMACLLAEDSQAKGPRRREIIAALLALPDAVRAALQAGEAVRELAESLKHESSLLVFGRGWHYATALEVALKVKEVALMHSEGILAGEMKHGPLALVDGDMPLLVIATRDGHSSKMASVVQQLRARGGKLVILASDGDEEMRKEVEAAAPGTTRLITVPATVDCLQPVLNVVPLQLLSYHLAVLRGHNVDQPRNLAKSVTVE